MPGSPAEGAGIEAGDYILAINDHMVSSPQELKEKIESLAATDTINVSVWRDGQTSTKQVALASEAKQLPDGHRSWLGVMLSGGSDQAAGVTIQRVHPRGPAAQAGLQSGDQVSSIDNQQVDSIEQFISMVQDYEPGDELQLTVRRGDQQIDLSAQLGDVRDAPLPWFRQSFRMPMDSGEHAPEQRFGDDSLSQPSEDMNIMVEMIDDMRQQIRSLQRQVDELAKPAAPAVDSALDGIDRAPRGAPEQEDSSRLDRAGPQLTKFVQFDGRRFPSDYRSDRRSARRYDRFYRDDYDRYPYNYRSYYGNRGYLTYPYRYYNYGGRPFYYGGGYPYGYRGGVRIGPNFSIWW